MINKLLQISKEEGRQSIFLLGEGLYVLRLKCYSGPGVLGIITLATSAVLGDLQDCTSGCSEDCVMPGIDPVGHWYPVPSQPLCPLSGFSLLKVLMNSMFFVLFSFCCCCCSFVFV